MNKTFCDIIEVGQFLEKHRMSRLNSYGIENEAVFDLEKFSKGESPEGYASAPKPNTLFRGQTKSYDTLRPTIYRKHIRSTLQENLSLKIGDDTLFMPHPHYSRELETNFYFSCIKAIELIGEISAKFRGFPGEVNGHALCQHYGLPTHYLDLSEDVWISAFFATHMFEAGQYKPCSDGIGVIYVIDLEKLPMDVVHEIGFQPLPRPFAQRGWLLQVPPEVNLLSHQAVWSVYFQHNLKASKYISERYNEGKDLLLDDEISKTVEDMLKTRKVTETGIEGYLQKIPQSERVWLRNRIMNLFDGNVKVM